MKSINLNNIKECWNYLKQHSQKERLFETNFSTTVTEEDVGPVPFESRWALRKFSLRSESLLNCMADMFYVKDSSMRCIIRWPRKKNCIEFELLNKHAGSVPDYVADFETYDDFKNYVHSENKTVKEYKSSIESITRTVEQLNILKEILTEALMSFACVSMLSCAG